MKVVGEFFKKAEKKRVGYGSLPQSLRKSVVPGQTGLERGHMKNITA